MGWAKYVQRYQKRADRIELLQVKGFPQDASHFNFEEFIPEEDALLVKILREAGAGMSA